MTKPQNVERFHAVYDSQKDHRLHLFGALAELVSPESVLYPGSYVDIAPSVFFDRVHYVDLDKRANRFFAERDGVAGLVAAKKAQLGLPSGAVAFRFEHADYRQPLAVEARSVELLISLYAGFISEHCTQYLAAGGYLFVNDSHGDASMASLDDRYRLVAVAIEEDGRFVMSSEELDTYLVPKKGNPPTAAGLHATGRRFVYAKAPFAYLFQRTL